MDGAVVFVMVGVLTIVIGAGLGYGFAAVKFLTELQATNREKQELQRQLAATSARNPTASSQQPAPAQPSSHQQPVSAQPESPATPLPATAEVTKSQKVSSTNSPTPAAANSSPTTSAPQPKIDPALDNAHEAASWQRLIAEAAARAQSDVLCIVDIDYLRQYREQYGQSLGDYVASHVEQVVRDSLRELGAVISRYEGQEFILAWPAELGTASKRLFAARKTTAKLRADVEQAFLQVGSERLTVTISLGLALCEPGLSGEQVIARADEALAAAKKAGRNRGYYHSGQECLPVEPLELLADPKMPDENSKINKRARSTSGVRERRRHERKPCSNINLLAPCSDDVLPSMDKFQRVQFFDISSSGFSMLVQTVPTTSQFAVALINARGLIFMSAEVANIRQAKRVAANDKPLLIVGCRFRQRLYPQETRNGNEGSSLERQLRLI